MQDLIAGGVVLPNHFSGVFIYCNEAGRLRRGDFIVIFDLAIRSFQEYEVSPNKGRRIGHVMRIDAKFLHHIELPYNIGVQFAFIDFILDLAVILSIKKPFCIQTDKLAAICHIIGAFFFYRWRGADPLLGPIVRRS